MDLLQDPGSISAGSGKTSRDYIHELQRKGYTDNYDTYIYIELLFCMCIYIYIFTWRIYIYVIQLSNIYMTKLLRIIYQEIYRSISTASKTLKYHDVQWMFQVLVKGGR